MRVKTGSISMERFYFSHEIRLEKEVEEIFTLLFEQRENSFFRKEPIYQEAEFRFGRGVYASIIGFPQHDKRMGHMGAAFSIGKRHSELYLRLSSLRQYLVYNSKNKENDKYEVDNRFLKIPIMHRMEIQHLQEGAYFFRFDLKLEEPTEFERFAPATIEKYSGNELETTFEWLEIEDRIIGISLSSDRERREQENLGTNTNPDLEQELKLQWLEVYYAFPMFDKDRLTLGLMGNHFENRIDSPIATERYRMRLLSRQLYGLFEKSLGKKIQAIYSIQGGEMELLKENLSKDEFLDKSSIQLKAGIGVVWFEESSYRIFLNSTWDLDLFQERQWDGGSIEVQFKF